MRAVWVDAGSDARGDLGTRFGITDPYFDGRWLATKGTSALGYLRDYQAAGFAPGIFLCSQGFDSLGAWPSASTTAPGVWGDWAYELVQKQVAPGTGGSFPKVHLNCEIHDPDWILAMLRRWRAHSPRRETALVIEGMQGGWFGAIAQKVIDLNVRVYAEAFHGNMERSESADIFDDLYQRLEVFSEGQIGLCLDAAQLGAWWGVNVPAVAFTQGRLP